MQPQVYVGVFVWCRSKKHLSVIRGSVLVCADGNIVDVAEGFGMTSSVQELIAKQGWSFEETRVLRAKENEFFFPGFVDTHIHAPQYPNAGIFGKTTLLDWLKTYTYPLEASFSDLDKAARVYETCISRTLAHGTTSAAYYATIHVPATKVLASICRRKGQRALIGRVCMDHPSALVDYYRDEDSSASTIHNMQVIEHVRSLDPTGTLIAPILTPRSAVSCTSEQLLSIRDMANDAECPVRIQTHLSENLSEIALVKSMWPSHRDYTHVYDAHGLLTPRTILAHAIHLADSEIQCIAKRRAKVSHCPVSNSALGSGMCQVRRLMEQGIVVGLGSDISGGYSPSILEAARQACLISRLVASGAAPDPKSPVDGPRPLNDDSLDTVPDEHPALSVEEALWMATRGGAEVFGWEAMIGAFEVGMQFDAQLIAFDAQKGDLGNAHDHGDFQVFGWETWEERVAKWVYCGDDRNTEKVWVGGKLVHTRSDEAGISH